MRFKIDAGLLIKLDDVLSRSTVIFINLPSTVRIKCNYGFQRKSIHFLDCKEMDEVEEMRNKEKVYKRDCGDCL